MQFSIPSGVLPVSSLHMDYVVDVMPRLLWKRCLFLEPTYYWVNYSNHR